jgi:ornithine cyclodeaminase
VQRSVDERRWVRIEVLNPKLHSAPASNTPAQTPLLVCDSRAQCAQQVELHHALAGGADLPVTELGEITSGRQPGRRSDDQITVCDLTGTGVQDTAIALLAYRKAIAAALGTRIDN